MKIFSTTNVTVVGKSSSLSKDGQSTYYKLACLQNGQATNLSVTEDIYDSIPSGIVEASFETSYEDKYGSFKLERIIEIVSVNGAKPDAKQTASATASK